MNIEDELEPRCSFCGWSDGDHGDGCLYNDYDNNNPQLRPLPNWFFKVIRKIAERERTSH